MNKSLLQVENCFPVVMEIIAKNNHFDEPHGDAEPNLTFSYSPLRFIQSDDLQSAAFKVEL